MVVEASCVCGEAFGLKDEYAGHIKECPKCGQNIEVPSHSRGDQVDNAFDRDKFLLRQQHFAISEKYHVWDDQEESILFIQRPRHLFRNLFAVFGALLAGGCIVAAVIVVDRALWQLDERAGIAFIFVGIAAVVVGTYAVGLALSKKRHVTIYRDISKKGRLVEILQDKKFHLINVEYTVTDDEGNVLAHLRKNHIYDFVRKRWYCTNAAGGLLCVVKEDSILLSLLRRFLGTFFGLLRRNFVFYDGDGSTEIVIGEFSRSFTLLDRYVLDMSDDPHRRFDRRIAVAIGVMLDTGERR